MESAYNFGEIPFYSSYTERILLSSHMLEMENVARLNTRAKLCCLQQKKKRVSACWLFYFHFPLFGSKREKKMTWDMAAAAAAQVRLYKSLALYVVDIIMRAYKNRKFWSWLRWLWQSAAAAVRSIRHPWDSLLLLLGAKCDDGTSLCGIRLNRILSCFSGRRPQHKRRNQIALYLSPSRQRDVSVGRVKGVAAAPANKTPSIHPSSSWWTIAKVNRVPCQVTESARHRKEVMGFFRTKMCRDAKCVATIISFFRAIQHGIIYRREKRYDTNTCRCV